MISSSYARNPMTRYLLERAAHADERRRNLDPSKWYHLRTEILPTDLQNRFIKSEFDKETDHFLNTCHEKSEWVLTQFFHSILRTFLGIFMSVTTINGLLSRGSMFVFSHCQFKKLTNITDTWKENSLLDLGAGDGAVTRVIAGHFENIFVTEQSSTMVSRLTERGYRILGIDNWQTQQYNVISVLNLLDRIDDPSKLLNDVRHALDPSGLAIVALVLPYDPGVESGTGFRAPASKLNIHGRTVEEQITSFVYDVLFPAGFVVTSFTKVPYLCEGDLYEDFFLLDDYVFILKLRTE